ncbi:MAG: putative Ig domain-containing protein [Akkermansiaceae bacterium]
MNTTFSRLIFTLLLSCPLGAIKTQAAVERLGDKATITIPNTWTVRERTTSTLVAVNASGAVELIIYYFVPDVQNSITGETYKALNSILEWYLNSAELENLKGFTEYGLPITEIAEKTTFSAGITANKNFYAGKIIRRFSFFDSPSTYGCLCTTQYLTDGAKGYLVQNFIYDWASESEAIEASQVLDSLKSSNIISPLSDPDGDGVNNFEEIILHRTNPNYPDHGKTYQGPTITSSLSKVSLRLKKRMTPQAVKTNFNANSFIASDLPPGTKISATTGVITGIPSKKGTYIVKITARNNGGRNPTKSVMVTKSFTVF